MAKEVLPINDVIPKVEIKYHKCNKCEHESSNCRRNIQIFGKCSYGEATKTYLQMLPTSLVKASLLLQNTEAFLGGESAYLREPAPQEEGGLFGADFTKAYTPSSENLFPPVLILLRGA
jgi:hypothetical protein